MCILEEPGLTVDKLMSYYLDRIKKEDKNVNRIKKFYSNEEEFDKLMEQIIEKDAKRIVAFLEQKAYTPNIENNLPTPWNAFFTILEIAQREGKEFPPYDTLTKTYPSRTLMYMGWTFSWIHGENTLISIFNRKDELVYRF